MIAHKPVKVSSMKNSLTSSFYIQSSSWLTSLIVHGSKDFFIIIQISESSIYYITRHILTLVLVLLDTHSLFSHLPENVDLVHFWSHKSDQTFNFLPLHLVLHLQEFWGFNVLIIILTPKLFLTFYSTLTWNLTEPETFCSLIPEFSVCFLFSSKYDHQWMN